jgi:hypothetical protein
MIMTTRREVLPGAAAAAVGEVDDGLVLNRLPIWAPDARVRQKILVTNPARLYQF